MQLSNEGLSIKLKIKKPKFLSSNVYFYIMIINLYTMYYSYLFSRLIQCQKNKIKYQNHLMIKLIIPIIFPIHCFIKTF